LLQHEGIAMGGVLAKNNVFWVCFYCETSLGIECKTRHEYPRARMETKKTIKTLRMALL